MSLITEVDDKFPFEVVGGADWMLRRRVIDETGLTGLYDIELLYPANVVVQVPGADV